MTTFQNYNRDFVVLLRKAVSAALIWTILCFLSAYWNVDTKKNNTMELAHKEALTVFNKDQAFRFWATDHQGVYVPVTNRTSPNKYLSHIEERDLVTPSGKQLTLMNPAYMLRQVMDHYATLYSTTSHITSLKVLNPINEPDDWERKALQKFDDGEKEVMAVALIEGHQFLRFMKPMYTTEGCLTCHAQQGYGLGDVRGGVSVSIPLAPYLELETRSIHRLYISHLFFFYWGIGVIVFFYYRIKQRMMDQNVAARIIREQSEKIKMFAYSVIHDLKNPVIAIHGLTNLLEKKYHDILEGKGGDYCEKITESAAQLELLVEQLNDYIVAKEHPLTIKELDVREICETVRAEYDEQLRKRSISWFGPSLSSTIRADRIAILRIMRNFVDNALKYGGDELSEIHINYKESEKFHTLCVSNDGKAILPSDYQKLFEQFTRDCTDHKVEGIGLGLAIIKELVALHAGEVWGESDEGEGAKFCFTIAKQL